MNKFWLFDNVARWLNNEGYTHTKEKNDDAVFQIKVEDPTGMHIFEPKKQEGVLVIELAINIPSKLDNLYRNYNNNEKNELEKKMKEIANEHEIELRFFAGVEGIKSNLYIVIDDEKNIQFEFFKKQLKIGKNLMSCLGQIIILIMIVIYFIIII